MQKQKERWKKLLPYEKKFEVASYILLLISVISFIFEILDKTKVLPVAFDFYILTIGLLLFALACNAVASWRTERTSAKGSVGLAIWCAITIIWEIVKIFI